MAALDSLINGLGLAVNFAHAVAPRLLELILAIGTLVMIVRFAVWMFSRERKGG
jgi:hypothetical protein